MASDKKESRSTQLIAVLLTAVFVGASYTFMTRYKSGSTEGTTTETPTTQSNIDDAQDLAEIPGSGDADSPVDTIRAVKQYARQAAEAAAGATENLAEYKQLNTEEMQAMKESMQTKASETAQVIKQGLGEMKAEMSNFQTLLQGQLQGSGNKQPITPQVQQDPDAWISIPPVNESSAQGGQSSTLVEQVAAFSNIEEQGGYIVNNGFLLTESNIADASNLSVNESGKVPVATIPENSPLLNGVTLSTLIGRVPKGGAVVEPYDFFVMTGNENLTSQLHHIPFLDNAIWRGKATGDRVLECIRGKIFSVTFVFTDGTILTNNSGTEEQPLAELQTPTGSNCVPGTYASNTGEYLAMLSAAGGLSGLGEAIANNETINSVTSSGSIIERIDGDAGKFFAGKALSEGAQQAARIIEQEYNASFASVVKGSGLPINMVATKQIEIDYDVNGRKVSYVDPEDYIE